MTIYYIKILSCKILKGSLQIVVSIQTDLGESTLPESCRLTLSINDGRTTHQELLDWSATDICLKATCPLKSKTAKDHHISILPVENKLAPAPYVQCLNRFIGSTTIIGCSTVMRDTYTHLSDRTFNGLIISESTQDSIVSHIWDAGLVLSSLINSEINHSFSSHLHSILRSAKSVIELGTGVGILGLTIAKTYPNLRVEMTDLGSARELVEHNIRQNKLNVTFKALDWTEVMVHKQEWDVIVMADVSYNDTYHSSLLHTIKSLKSPTTKIIFASKFRHQNERGFIETLTNTYSCSEHLILDDGMVTSNARLGSIEFLIFS